MNDDVGDEIPSDIEQLVIVPVGFDKVRSDGAGLIRLGFFWSLSGLAPISGWIVSLHEINNNGLPFILWLLASPLVVAGSVATALGVKEEGYQDELVHNRGVASLIMNTLFFFMPFLFPPA